MLLFGLHIPQRGVEGVSWCEGADKLRRAVLPQNDLRQVAAEEKPQSLCDRVSAGVFKDEQVAGLQPGQGDAAHQNIIGRTQAAAECPVLLRPLLRGKMAQVRALHSHDLSQIVQVVHAAVHYAVMLAVMILTIHGGCQVKAAFGGVKAAHLNSQVRPPCSLLQCRGEGSGRGKGVGEVIAVKVRHGQAGAVFQLRQAQAEGLLDLIIKRLQHGQLFLLGGQLFALGADKIVNADKVKIRCFCAVF